MKRFSTPKRARTSRDDDRIDLGASEIPLRVRRHPRAKSITLNVDPIRRVATVTMPRYCAKKEALEFADLHRQWIIDQLLSSKPAQPFRDGENFPFRGEPHRIQASGVSRGRTKRVESPSPTIVVGGHVDHLNRRLTDWLKRQAANELTRHVDRFATSLGRERGRIKIRDMSTRWGSCKSDGGMAFCWRLIMAPPYVLEYVAAHECAHLIYMDHSQAFWRTVDTLGVDRRRAKNWLDENGRDLFLYGVKAESVGHQ